MSFISKWPKRKYSNPSQSWQVSSLWIQTYLNSRSPQGNIFETPNAKRGKLPSMIKTKVSHICLPPLPQRLHFYYFHNLLPMTPFPQHPQIKAIKHAPLSPDVSNQFGITLLPQRTVCSSSLLDPESLLNNVFYLHLVGVTSQHSFFPTEDTHPSSSFFFSYRFIPN